MKRKVGGGVRIALLFMLFLVALPWVSFGETKGRLDYSSLFITGVDNVKSIGQDSNGNVYVAQSSPPTIKKYSSTGVFIEDIISFKSDKYIEDMYLKDNFIYILFQSSPAVKIDFEGNVQSYYGIFGYNNSSADAYLYYPEAIIVDSNDRVLIGTNYDTIKIFEGSGAYFDSKKLSYQPIDGINIDSDGNMYCVSNNCIIKHVLFNTSAIFWHKELASPGCKIELADNGEFFVVESDGDNGYLEYFDKNRERINTISETSYVGLREQFKDPKDVYLLDENILLVAESSKGNVIAFNYTPPKYELTYYGNDNDSGTVPNVQAISKDTEVVLSDNTGNLCKEGYTFGGWNTKEDGTGTVYSTGAKIKVTGDLSLYAKWLKNYTISFQTNSEATIDSQAKNEGNLVDVPTGIEKSGYTFGGWYTDESFNSEWNFATDTVADKNITLYAKWTANTNKLIYNGNGSKKTTGNVTEMPADTTRTTDSVEALRANAYILDGYTFTGWNTQADGNGTAYADKADFKMPAAATTTLYAQWTANENTLVYDANGGTGSMENEKHVTDSVFNLTQNKFTREGYTFTGWIGEVASGGQSPLLADGSLQKMPSNSTVTLYAQWTANTNKLKYDSNFPEKGVDSEGKTGSMSAEDHDTDSKFKLTPNVYACEGYTFAGWNTQADGNGVAYEEGVEFTMSAEATTTLYAQWTANIYTIKFDANGGSGTMESEQHATGSSFVLPLNKFTREGYTFAGWGEYDSDEYDEEDLVPNGFKVKEFFGDSVTLYAQWKLIIDTDLKDLSVSGYDLNETFDSSQLKYTVSNVTGSAITISASVDADQFSTVTIAGTDVTTGGAVSVDLDNGANSFDIVVTAQDKTTTKTYNLVINRLSDKANLKRFEVDGYELTPEFNKNTTSYDLHVTSGSALTLYIEAEDSGATIDYGSYVTSGSAVTLPVDVGLNIYTFKVTAENGIDNNAYSLRVDRDNDDPRPESIEVFGATLKSAYDKNTGTYTLSTVTAENVIFKVSIQESSKIQVNGTTANSGQQVPVSLDIGENTIDIEIIAEDGSHTKTYSFTVYRNSVNAALSDIELTGTDYQTEFSAGVFDYTLSPVTKDSIDVIPVTASEKATVTVNGEAVASGSSHTVPLILGDNTIKVVVTAEDGQTTSTYTLSVERQISGLSLSGLSIKGYDLNPAFDPDTLNYNLTVYTEDSVVLTATSGENKDITLGGTALASGTEKILSLSAGKNVFTLVVKSPYSESSKTYTVTIYKAEKSALLKSLELTGTDYQTEFNAGVFDYTLSPVTKDSIVVTPVTASEKATVTVNGEAVTSGSSHTVPLTLGDNTIKVVVTAEDGQTTSTYTLSVDRQISDLNLNSLSIKGYDLTPVFDPDTLSYGLKVYTEDSVVLTAESGEATNITLNGEALESGAEKTLNLSTGENVFTLKTTSPYSESSRTYTVTIYKMEETALLSDLKVYNTNFKTAFESGVLTYTLSPITGSEITVQPEVASEKSTVTVNGITIDGGEKVTVPLTIGENTVKVVVTAEDGKTKNTYTLKITRSRKSSSHSSGSSSHSSSSNNSSSTSESTQDTNTTHKTNVVVNGKSQSAGTITTKTEAGHKTASVALDQNILKSLLKNIAESNTDNILAVPVPVSGTDKVDTLMNGDIVKQLEESHFKLTVRSDDVEYILPAEEVHISDVAKSLDVSEENLENVTVDVKIEKLSGNIQAQVIQDAENQSYSVVYPPVEFTVEAKVTTQSGETKTVEVSTFNNYVDRRIEIPEDVDPQNITTAVLYNADGTFSHIPTTIIEENGKYYAAIHSMTNSCYSIIHNPMEVASVKGHWSQQAVNDLASRLVIDDTDGFDPDKAITRGDYIEYLVKGLGLYKTGVAHEQVFTDMPMAYADSLTIAKEYGIVSGYSDGSIHAESEITREEAMVILNNALNALNLLEENEGTVKTFVDSEELSTWAKASANRITELGIMNGTSANTLDPKGTYTYGQAAATIENLLKHAVLINE